MLYLGAHENLGSVNETLKSIPLPRKMGGKQSCNGNVAGQFEIFSLKIVLCLVFLCHIITPVSVMKMSYNHPFIVTSEPMTMMRGKKMGLSTIKDPLYKHRLSETLFLSRGETWN